MWIIKSKVRKANRKKLHLIFAYKGFIPTAGSFRAIKTSKAYEKNRSFKQEEIQIVSPIKPNVTGNQINIILIFKKVPLKPTGLK